MRRSFFWFVAFLFLQVKALNSNHNYFLRRVTRAVNNRYQNTSWHNTDPSWYGSKPNNTHIGSNGYPSGYNPQQSAGNTVNHAWNNPGGQYNQGYPPNNLTAINNRPQNVYGPNEFPSGYNSQGSGVNQAWNNPGGQYYQGNNSREPGWQPHSNSGYNNGYNSPQPFNSTGPQLINPAPHWQNPGGSGSIYPSLPSSNPYGYNTKPAPWNDNGQQWNNPPNQYYPVANDLTLQRYKRANIPRTRWNSTHSNKYPGNWTNIYHGNGTYSKYNSSGIHDSFHSRFRRNSFHSRFRRSSHSSYHRHHNVSWYNRDPDWYNISQSAWNGYNPEWNKPGSRFYNWQDYYERHKANHYIPPPPNYDPPPQYWPRHHDWTRFIPPPPNFQPPQGCPCSNNNTLPHGNGTSVGNGAATNSTSSWVPEDGDGSNGAAANGTKPGVPENGPNFNGSGVNDTGRWGSELPDLEGGYEITPAPL